jgi:hypothetical protein
MRKSTWESASASFCARQFTIGMWRVLDIGTVRKSYICFTINSIEFKCVCQKVMNFERLFKCVSFLAVIYILQSSSNLWFNCRMTVTVDRPFPSSTSYPMIWSNALGWGGRTGWVAFRSHGLQSGLKSRKGEFSVV